MIKDFLQTYLPDPTDVNPEEILRVRQRISAYVRQFWPELDTRPNTPFGDLVLTPMATIMALNEIAARRFTNDLDLTRVANGIYYNEEFLQGFVRNFGVNLAEPVNATGTVRLVFSANADYVISTSSQFRFGSSVFSPDTEDSEIVIRSMGTIGAKYVLHRGASNNYEVHIPVVGPAGVSVDDGAGATTNLDITNFLAASAAGNFNSGAAPTSIVGQAQQALQTYASAGLTSRSGAMSFVHLRWPQISNVGATVTGDREMVRVGSNPLGVAIGAMDLFLRSSVDLPKHTLKTRLTYDPDQQAWVGLLDTDLVPAFFDLSTGIFQVGNFLNSRGVNTIYSRSNHDEIDDLSVTYSKNEDLGIVINDTDPTGFEEGYVTQPTILASDGSTMSTSGSFAGYIFGRADAKTVELRFDSEAESSGLDGVRVSVIDTDTGELDTIFIIPSDSGTYGVVDKTTIGYQRRFKGLEISFHPVSGVFDPASTIGMKFSFTYQGRTSYFETTFPYEPLIQSVDQHVQSRDNKPANVSILTRSFIVCYIDMFVINYRIPRGELVDEETAREAIYRYLGSISYPDTYEETRILEILSNYGATGISSIQKSGVFHPSLADVFEHKDGTTTVIEKEQTTTLIPTANAFGYGVRNITYVIEPNTIRFNAKLV